MELFNSLNEEQKRKVEEKVNEIIESDKTLITTDINELKEKVAKSMYNILKG